MTGTGQPRPGTSRPPTPSSRRGTLLETPTSRRQADYEHSDYCIAQHLASDLPLQNYRVV
jgi:hypothetical protein